MSALWLSLPSYRRIAEPAKRKRVNPISEKRRREGKEYRRLRLIFLAKHPWCAVFPDKRSTEPHHTKGRAGRNYLDVSTWLPVSRAGHEKIGREPAWAYRMGFNQIRT